MTDEGNKNNDKKIAKVERKINAVYSEAQKDLEAKTKVFLEKMYAKKAIKDAELKAGKITKAEHDSWWKGQMFQLQQWGAKQQEVLNVIDNANKEAAHIVNLGTMDSFIGGANWQAYYIEKDIGASVGFSLYDRDSVARLMVDNPDVLPKWKIDEPKEYTWNKQKVQNALTQSIIQGKSLEETSKRIATALGNSNRNLALTHAQTAMAGAQNAGRNVSLMRAKTLGIDVMKQWMATLDGHTRDSHRDMDGEKQKVGDAWHPMKFSNGCRFPGDPDGPAHEVFNCRCTLVGSVQGFPEDYKRYDNIDGKPVKNMSYREWEKAKGFEEKKAPKITKAQQKKIDKANIDLQVAEAKLNAVDQDIKDKGADKVFSGIWYNQDITYADWEDKKDSIQAKKDYYDQQIAKYGQNGQTSMVEKMRQKKAELEEFEKNGEEYSKLFKQKAEAEAMVKESKKALNELMPKPKMIGKFEAEAYSQERKDAAVWAQTKREADDALRPTCGEVWRNATSAEKDGIYEYTSSYSKYNEPLRGWEYGRSNYSSGSGFLGVGNTDLNAGSARNGKNLNAMTDIIEKSTYNKDIWLQRGCDYGGMDKFFNVDMDLLRNGTQEEIEAAILGATPTEFGFMSCGSSKGAGFNRSIILNVYAPSGTKMMYVEPFSAFGNGDKRRWDGKSKQSSFGGELETILQQGTQFRVTKVTRRSKYDTIFIDLEVIDQKEPQRWIP